MNPEFIQDVDEPWWQPPSYYLFSYWSDRKSPELRWLSSIVFCQLQSNSHIICAFLLSHESFWLIFDRCMGRNGQPKACLCHKELTTWKSIDNTDDGCFLDAISLFCSWYLFQSFSTPSPHRIHVCFLQVSKLQVSCHSWTKNQTWYSWLLKRYTADLVSSLKPKSRTTGYCLLSWYHFAWPSRTQCHWPLYSRDLPWKQQTDCRFRTSNRKKGLLHFESQVWLGRYRNTTSKYQRFRVFNLDLTKNILQFESAKTFRLTNWPE